MLRAVVSPHAYSASRLPQVYYSMVEWCVLGYFLIMAGNACLAWLSERLQISGAAESWLKLLVNERWVWVGPLMAVLALYLFTVLSVPSSAGAPTMYRLF
jgi:hypothetical protein